MLVLDGLSYRHAGSSAPALRSVTLRLAEGEVLGLVGANESGKSTLCLVASGLAPRVVGGHVSGRITLDSEDMLELPRHEVASRVGIVFQNPATQLSGVAATVREEVAFGPGNLGVPLAELIARTDEALRALGIEALADRDPARLSGGQQQLVAIASSLAMRPRHLVLDEPTAQLDPAGTSLVGDAIARLAGSGSSILLVEHKTDLVARIASRVAVLDAGAIVLEGPAPSVLADPRLPRLGVPEPQHVRIRALAREAGLSDRVLQALVEHALGAAP